MNRILRYLIIFSLFLGNKFVAAQLNPEKESYYKWFDKSIGNENTELFNGEFYFKTFRTQNQDHNFFINTDYILGDIEFNNQNYYDIPIKYDTYQDELIAYLKDSHGGKNPIQLNKKFIKKFIIYDRIFKFLNLTINQTTLSGFFEISYEGDAVVFYIKHNKIKKTYIEKDILYNRFNMGNDYILFYKNSHYSIDGKKDLKKIFPSLKKEINLQYRKNKSLKKSDYDSFLKTIIQQIEQRL